MSARIPKYVLKAGIDAVYTFRDWMECEPDAEGDCMDAHRDALTALKNVLGRDPAVLQFLSAEDVEDYLGSTA